MVQNISVNYTGKINKNSFQLIMIKVSTLKQSKKMSWALVVQHELKPQRNVVSTTTTNGKDTSSKIRVANKSLFAQILVSLLVHFILLWVIF